MQIHVVKGGDSLYTIAKKYGANYIELARENGFNLQDTLVIGQTIVINSGEISPKAGIVEVNGYAFVNIADDVLTKTLPYLTYLSLFSYEARADGTFKPIAAPAAEDKIIAKAIDARVMPTMVVSNIGASGNFESTLAREILTNPTTIDKLIDNLLKTMHTKKYAGLDVDFEFVLPSDRAAYTEFLAKCAEKMHNNGFFISCAIPAKDAESTTDPLTGAYDYAAIGAIVGNVTLMTYDWGYNKPADGSRPHQQSRECNKVRGITDGVRQNLDGHTKLRLRLAYASNSRKPRQSHWHHCRRRPSSQAQSIHTVRHNLTNAILRILH